MRRRPTTTAQLAAVTAALLAGLLLAPASAASAGSSAQAVGPASAQASALEVDRRKTAGHQRLQRVVQRAGVVPVTGTTTTLAVPTYADRVLALSNRERTVRGLRPLAPSACAAGFARSWAAALSRAGVLSHQPLRPVLSTCRARQVGENVAFGSVTPEQLVAMWMASPGHRANLLQPAFTHLGVGAVATPGGRVFGVQVLLAL